MATYPNTRNQPPAPPLFRRRETAVFFFALVSSRPNDHLCNDRCPVAAMELLKTRVFLLLGLLPSPSGAPLAALGSLLWLIGAPYRVHGCSKQVCFCYKAPGTAIGIYVGLLCSSLWLYSSSTGLRLMLLGLGIVLSTKQCLFDTLGSWGLRWFSDSFTPGLTL